jgi:hypothetical protein
MAAIDGFSAFKVVEPEAVQCGVGQSQHAVEIVSLLLKFWCPIAAMRQPVAKVERAAQFANDPAPCDLSVEPNRENIFQRRPLMFLLVDLPKSA